MVLLQLLLYGLIYKSLAVLQTRKFSKVKWFLSSLEKVVIPLNPARRWEEENQFRPGIRDNMSSCTTLSAGRGGPGIKLVHCSSTLKDVCMINKFTHIHIQSKRMFSINYTWFQRLTILEYRTEIEKLADSFKLTWFTLPDSYKIPRNPCQSFEIFWLFIYPWGCAKFCQMYVSPW